MWGQHETIAADKPDKRVPQWTAPTPTTTTTLIPHRSQRVLSDIPRHHTNVVKMGANQSRPSDAAISEKLVERLQALHMKDERSTSEKDGFVVVGADARKSYTLLMTGIDLI
jgi:hypothetical protein